MKADLNQKLIDLIDMLKLSEAPIPQEILDKVNSGVFEQIQCGDLWITPHGVWPVNEVPEYLEFYGYENIDVETMAKALDAMAETEVPLSVWAEFSSCVRAAADEQIKSDARFKVNFTHVKNPARKASKCTNNKQSQNKSSQVKKLAKSKLPRSFMTTAQVAMMKTFTRTSCHRTTRRTDSVQLWMTTTVSGTTGTSRL